MSDQILSNLFAYAGLALITIAGYLAWGLPAALTVMGIFLLIVGVAHAIKVVNSEREKAAKEQHKKMYARVTKTLQRGQPAEEDEPAGMSDADVYQALLEIRQNMLDGAYRDARKNLNFLISIFESTGWDG